MSALVLSAEMRRAELNVRAGHRERLFDLGVTKEALAALGAVQAPFGVERVEWLPGGLYEPSADGVPAVIMPVIEWDHFWGIPEPIDLIAFKTSTPSRWSWRLGQGWAMGDDLLNDDLPVPVVASPFDWIKAGGKAFCILDWEAPPECWSRLRQGPSLQFPDDVLRQRVRNALVAKSPLPVMELSHAY